MITRLPNLRHLRAFCEVAHSRNISLSSHHVHMSQPAITQAIAKLEAMLGAPLFERSSGGMLVTDPGRAFLERAERALGRLEAGAREAARLGLRKGGRGTVSFDRLVTSVQLRALLAVSDARNFTQAARLAGVSQPTLHRTARDLERLAGVALFSRTDRGIDLTTAARALAQQARLSFAELEQGYAEVAAWRGIDGGRIVVGTMPLARTFLLPTTINAFLRGRPDVQVSVVDGPYGDLLRGLRHGEIDCLIGALRDPAPMTDVSQEPLFDDTLAVVARTGHPLAGQTAVPLGALAAYPWVVPRQGTPTRNRFEAIFGGPGAARPRSIVESSSLILIREMLLDSDGITLISGHQIRHEQQLGLLAPLPVAVGGAPRPIGLTVRRDWRPTEAQAHFLDLLRRAAMLVRVPERGRRLFTN